MCVWNGRAREIRAPFVRDPPLVLFIGDYLSTRASSWSRRGVPSRVQVSFLFIPFIYSILTIPVASIFGVRAMSVR